MVYFKDLSISTSSLRKGLKKSGKFPIREAFKKKKCNKCYIALMSSQYILPRYALSCVMCQYLNLKMKSTVTDRNITNCKENENCQVISQVQSLLSNVEEALSSACDKMSSVNVEARKKILHNVSQILYQVECIVSSSSQPLDTTTDLWWDESGVHLEESYGQDDSLLSDVFLFSDARSSTSPFRSLSTSLSSRYSSA